MLRPAAILATTLFPATALSQEAPAQTIDPTAQVFDLQSTNGNVRLCKAALELGKVLWSTETGAYIAHEYHLVQFELADGKLLCIPKFMAPE